MADKKEFNIDEGLKRLEEINHRLGEPEITLDESIELYKEGTLLAAKCQEELTGVETKLKIIGGSQEI